MFDRPVALAMAMAAVAHAAPQATPPGLGATVVTINTGMKYQQYDGMGVSQAFQRSSVLHGLHGLSPVNQTKTLDLLFSNTTGAGFTILRNGLGGSPSQILDHMLSIEPNSPELPGNSPNYTALPTDPPPVVGNSADQSQVWLAQQAIARGAVSIYADAWTADGYMKTDGKL